MNVTGLLTFLKEGGRPFHTWASPEGKGLLSKFRPAFGTWIPPVAADCIVNVDSVYCTKEKPDIVKHCQWHTGVWLSSAHLGTNVNHLHSQCMAVADASLYLPRMMPAGYICAGACDGRSLPVCRRLWRSLPARVQALVTVAPCPCAGACEGRSLPVCKVSMQHLHMAGVLKCRACEHRTRHVLTGTRQSSERAWALRNSAGNEI